MTPLGKFVIPHSSCAPGYIGTVATAPGVVPADPLPSVRKATSWPGKVGEVPVEPGVECEKRGMNYLRRITR